LYWLVLFAVLLLLCVCSINSYFTGRVLDAFEQTFGSCRSICEWFQVWMFHRMEWRVMDVLLFISLATVNLNPGCGFSCSRYYRFDAWWEANILCWYFIMNMKIAAQRAALVDSVSKRKALADKNDHYWLQSIFLKSPLLRLVCLCN
jgi:hypothetical protein